MNISGRIIKVKNFWSCTQQPDWWPHDVPFESPGKRGMIFFFYKRLCSKISLSGCEFF